MNLEQIDNKAFSKIQTRTVEKLNLNTNITQLIPGLRSLRE